MSNKYWISIVASSDMETIQRERCSNCGRIVCSRGCCHCVVIFYSFVTRQGLQLHCVFGAEPSRYAKSKVQNPNDSWKIHSALLFLYLDHELFKRVLHLVSRLYSVNTSLKIVTAHTFPMKQMTHFFHLRLFSPAHSIDIFRKLK